MTAVIKKDNKSGVCYRLFCLAVVFCNAVYRSLKRLAKGKHGQKIQNIFSFLAFACLGAVVYLCAFLEKDNISILQTGLLSVLFLGGFGLFSDLAGAFRPYRYLKKQAARCSRKRNVTVVRTGEKTHKCA